MLKVSVALATYNGARFLREQLDSIASQTVLPDELVISDDGSTDDTVAVAREFATTVSFPIHTHVNEVRLGFRANFMAATRSCTSDLIFFCDQDDVWLPHKLETVRDAFGDPGTLLVYHGAAVVNAEGQRYASLMEATTERGLLAQHPVHPWHYSFGLVQAFRRELRAYDAFWPQSLDHVVEGERLAHDQWYFFIALVLGGVRYLDEELLLYRQHGANTFGAPEEQGAWRKLVALFFHDPTWDARRLAAAHNRAAILRSIVTAMPMADEDRLIDIAGRYDALTTRLKRRHAAHTHSSPAGRLAAFSASIVTGDYRGAPWAFDWKAAPRDLLAGVIRGGPGDTNRV